MSQPPPHPPSSRPAHFLRQLAGRDRTPHGNRCLGAVLAFVAGAINAGGFFAVGRYTSHMTGMVSSIADNLVVGEFTLVLAALATVVSFVLGAATTALLVNWARRRHAHSEYALPLLVEAMLLLSFGTLHAQAAAATGAAVAVTVLLLAFVMGLQNAVVTKISRAEIRTTHVTGVLTDLGIELGRAFYWNRQHPGNERPHVRANREKMQVHALILGMFLAGGVFGAFAFRGLGFRATLPFAAVLFGLALVPVLDDLRGRGGPRADGPQRVPRSS